MGFIYLFLRTGMLSLGSYTMKCALIKVASCHFPADAGTVWFF